MKDASQTKALVVDNGQFVSIARKLGEQIEKCFYWSPADRSLPLIQEAMIGDGFDDIERVKSIWDVVDDVDFFVFPDIGHCGLQKYLIGLGKPVWGARDGDSLESNRGKFLKALESMGMEVPPHEIIKGLTNLRLFLDDKEDKYIKISKWRGNFETFHWIDREQTQSELDNLAVEFGPAKEHVTFYVFDPIDTDIEDGCDTYCIDGEYPSLVLHGMEAKDKAYLGTMCKFDELPEQVRLVNEQFAPALKAFGYRGAFSTEVRILKDKFYFIDCTARFPSPPHQLETELWGNFAEILWQGANGVCIDPDPTAKFGAQALLTVSRNDKEWTAVKVPGSIKNSVKCGFCCEIDGLLCFPPNPLEHMAGYLVATGDTIEEAVNSLREKAEELPDGLKCEPESLASLLKQVASAEEKGMEFTSQKVPEPSIVLDD
jgi:hypothetical protein